MSYWTEARRLLWDDDEQILIVDSVKLTGPMKESVKVTVQPKDAFCCGNSFRPHSSRRKDNVLRPHTWVIESDKMPLADQRQFWKISDMPHTLRVFSGNKSIHAYIRTDDDVSLEQWQRIAADLKLIFPHADAKVLTNCAGLSRLPGGVRDDGTLQNVETIKKRVPLKTLTDWIARQDVIKNKDIKIYRDRVIEKNILDATNSDVGEAIRAMHLAKGQYAERQPARSRLYDRLIPSRFKAEQGKRNEQLIEIVTFLHDAVSAEVALEFAELFYESNAMIFVDPLEQHMIEARSHWARLDADYPSRLTDRKRDIYQAIPDREKVFFRICRSLAHGETSPDGEMTFAIPMTHFGHRMGLDGKQVSRLIDEFRVYGLLEPIAKGTQTKQLKDGTFVNGKAGVYRWTG